MSLIAKEDLSNPTRVIVLIPKTELTDEVLDLKSKEEAFLVENVHSSKSSFTDLVQNAVAPKGKKPNKSNSTTSTNGDGDLTKSNFGSSGGNGNGGSGRNNSVRPLPDPVDPDLSLDSVGGLDEHVKYLKRAVMYPLKQQGSLGAWGVDPPKGIMFHGPPGTGKTLLAKSLANELSKALNKNFSFFYQKGGECFEKYFGESERKLRELFHAANHYKPSIIFFDEIDGLCANRSSSSLTSQPYISVVTCLLGLIDSVKRGDVFIIGATNRIDSIDPAIIRPGRFDKQLGFALPCENGRRNIVGIHTRDWPRDRPSGSLLDGIVKRTNGYTGADLEKLCRDAVVASMTRSGEDTSSENVRVTVQDWSTAVQNMKHTSSNDFGSTMYVAQPVIPVLVPLVSNIVQEIVDGLKPLIPQDYFVTDSKTPTVTTNSASGLTRNAFMISFENATLEPLTSKALRGVLTHPSLGKMTTYVLNDETLAKSLSRKPLIEVFNDVLNQALNSEKPCFLYLPRIHILEGVLKHLKTEDTFYRQLMRIRGTNVVLLATAEGPLADHSEEMMGVFIGQSRKYNMRLPMDFERRAFFMPIFEELVGESAFPKKKMAKSSKGQPDYSMDFEEFLDQTVILTEGDNLDYMLALHEGLSLRKSDWKAGHITMELLSEEFGILLEEYDGKKFH